MESRESAELLMVGPVKLMVGPGRAQARVGPGLTTPLLSKQLGANDCTKRSHFLSTCDLISYSKFISEL